MSSSNFTPTQLNTIALFSNPRSGSTWLTSLLHQIPKSAVVDEPLWRGPFRTDITKPFIAGGKLKEVEQLKFHFNQPIPENEHWLEATTFFHKLFGLKILHPEIFNETNLKTLEKAETFIFKFNYANLMMPWLVNNFEFKSILLLRHPCAVVASQLEHYAFKEVSQCEAFVIPDCRYFELFDEHRKNLSDLKYPEEFLAATWALNFLNTAMHKLNDTAWITTTYERLVTAPDEELKRIFTRLEIEPPRYSPQILQASRTEGEKEFLNHSNQIDKWKLQLSKIQINRILNIVERFGIDAYDDDLEPKYDQVMSL